MRLEVILLAAFVAAAAAQESNRSTEPPAKAPSAETTAASKTATTATDEAAAREASKDPSLDPKTANLADLKVAGYRIENRNGEKLYCRKDNETGSRVKSNTFCLTRAQLVEIQQNTKQMMNDITRDNSPKSN